MADTEVDSKPAPSWADFRSKRTEAVPKHTLFGSSLEIKDQKELDDIMRMDMDAYEKEQSVKKQKARPRDVDPYVKARMPGDETLTQSRRQLTEQKSRMDQATQEFQLMDEDARYFRASPVRASPKNPPVRRHQWQHTEDDLQHSGPINSIGLHMYKNYNRDLHRQLPPVHQYSLIGDILRPGMEFNEGDRQNRQAVVDGSYKVDRRVRSHRAAAPNKPPSQTDLPKSAIYLPPNIKHLFGSTVCDAVLADAKKVENTMAEQKRLQAQHKTRRPTPAQEAAKDDIDPAYQSLGNALRQNICPGYSVNHKRSIAKTVYSDEVHKKRVPDPEEFRYQRDELSAWNEHNVLYNRMKRGWNEYLESLPKLAANWDRDAKRPPPSKPPPAPKSKSRPKKPRPAAQNTNKDDVVFEDIVFKTPPLTPPPAKSPTPPPRKPSYTRDDAFWKFYDQSLPS